MQIVWNENSDTVNYMPLFIIIITKLIQRCQKTLAQFTNEINKILFAKLFSKSGKHLSHSNCLCFQYWRGSQTNNQQDICMEEYTAFSTYIPWPDTEIATGKKK
jgi:hypothetical protein